MDKEFNLVNDFHKKYGHPTNVGFVPTRLTDSRKLKRIKWMMEELAEYAQASTLTKDIDALIDLLYFTLGTLVEHGVCPSNPFRFVHDANMRKSTEKDENGKTIKGEDFISPEDTLQVYLDSLMRHLPSK